MSHAPECSGRPYGCPKCEARGMTIDELFDHKCDAAVLLLDGDAHDLQHDTDGNVLCPRCSHRDVAMWAHDGKAWAADWWACETFSGGCGASGAVVPSHDHSHTQNGLMVGLPQVDSSRAQDRNAE